jgi:hypothetical protein
MHFPGWTMTTLDPATIEFTSGTRYPRWHDVRHPRAFNQLVTVEGEEPLFEGPAIVRLLHAETQNIVFRIGPDPSLVPKRFLWFEIENGGFTWLVQGYEIPDEADISGLELTVPALTIIAPARTTYVRASVHVTESSEDPPPEFTVNGFWLFKAYDDSVYPAPQLDAVIPGTDIFDIRALKETDDGKYIVTGIAIWHGGAHGDVGMISLYFDTRGSPSEFITHGEPFAIHIYRGFFDTARYMAAYTLQMNGIVGKEAIYRLLPPFATTPQEHHVFTPEPMRPSGGRAQARS